MKKLLLISLALISLNGCAAQKTPEQIAEEQRFQNDINMRINMVKVSKDDPANCAFLKGTTVIARGNVFEYGSYDGALNELKKTTFQAGGNYAVIDATRQPTAGPARYFHYDISGRIFKCP